MFSYIYILLIVAVTGNWYLCNNIIINLENENMQEFSEWHKSFLTGQTYTILHLKHSLYVLCIGTSGRKRCLNNNINEIYST